MEVGGVVLELLPNALFRVELDAGRRILAHATGSVRRNFVRIVEGDRVRVVLAPNDPGRGRITRVEDRSTAGRQGRRA